MKGMRRAAHSLAGLMLAASAAAVTASSAFVTAPRAVVPMIDSLTRLDMVDYFSSGLETPSTNVLGGDVKVTALDNNMLSFNTSSAGRRDILLLPAGRDTLIAVITTLSLPGSDSTIDFYTGSWRPLNRDSYFKVPSLKEWLTPAGRDKSATVAEAVPFMVVAYSFDPEESTLTLTNSFNSITSREDSTAIAGLVVPELHYKWTGKKFKPVKK